MLQQLLADSVGYVLVLAGVVVTITVGVMSILLPFLVFKIMRQVSAMNRSMARITELLEEAGGREAISAAHSAPSAGVRLGPSATRSAAVSAAGDKPLRLH